MEKHLKQEIEQLVQQQKRAEQEIEREVQKRLQNEKEAMHLALVKNLDKEDLEIAASLVQKATTWTMEEALADDLRLEEEAAAKAIKLIKEEEEAKAQVAKEKKANHTSPSQDLKSKADGKNDKTSQKETVEVEEEDFEAEGSEEEPSKGVFKDGCCVAVMSLARCMHFTFRTRSLCSRKSLSSCHCQKRRRTSLR